MKKILLIVAVLSLTAAAATAQPIRLGVKAGLSMLSTDVKSNVNYILMPGASTDNIYNEFKSKDIGWHAGLMARINLPLTNLYVQPELIYNHAAYQVLYGESRSRNLNYDTIELPVLLGFKILFLRANVGPTFTLAHITNGDMFKIESPDVGFQAGLGATMGKITIDLRYQGYFVKKWKDIDPHDITQKLKANDGYLSLSLGYFF